MPEHLTFKSRLLSLAHVVRRLVPKEWGGTETVVLTTCRYLQDRGVRSRILATAALSREGSDRIGGIPVQRFSYRYPLWGLPTSQREQMDKKGGNPISFSLFRYLLNQSDLGLVHLHTMGRLAAQVRMACRIRGIPYVLSLHGGHFCVPAQEQQYFRNLTRGYYDYGKPLGLLFGTRRVMTDAAGIICVGYDEYCSARTQFPEKRVVYLPHGVDVHYWVSGNAERFRDAHGLVGRRIVLCVGRIDPQKNQLALIRAFPRVLSRCRDASLVLIGPISVPSYLTECE